MSEIGPEMVVRVPKGWLCPVCGRVYAPVVMECLHCGKLPQSPAATAPPKGMATHTSGREPLRNNVGEWADVFRTCGKCGGQMQWHKGIALTSLPAKWEYRCKVCGNVEYEEIGTAHPPYTITLTNGINTL